MTKRMPTPKDGLRVGSDLTLGFIASLIDAMVRNGSTVGHVRDALYAMCSDQNTANLIAAVALRHLSQAEDLTDEQMETDHAELTQNVVDLLKAKGANALGSSGPIVSTRLS